eukprot:6204-Pelagomonas_calceolata.AAC.2
MVLSHAGAGNLHSECVLVFRSLCAGRGNLSGRMQARKEGPPSACSCCKLLTPIGTGLRGALAAIEIEMGSMDVL